MHIYIYIIYMYIHIHIYIYIYVCMYIYIYTFVYVNVYMLPHIQVSEHRKRGFPEEDIAKTFAMAQVSAY